MSLEEEFSEMIMYVTEMRRSFNRKLDDHLFIMQQQNERIDKQMRFIEEQKEVIDELAWQIRDLRASIRQVKESNKNNICVCNYENHQPRYKRTESTNREPNLDFRMRIEEIVEEDEDQEEDIYEPVDIAPRNWTPNAPVLIKPFHKPAEDLKSSQSFKETSTSEDMHLKRTTRYVAHSLPVENSTSTTINDAIAKLKLIDINSHDSIDEGLDDEVLIRTKQFKKFASNSQRGSSKVVCSLVSDIEEEYLPKDTELRSNINSYTSLPRNAVSDAVVDYNPVTNDEKKGNRITVKV